MRMKQKMIYQKRVNERAASKKVSEKWNELTSDGMPAWLAIFLYLITKR